MRVTGIETYVCHAYRTNWVFCRVMTDSDLYGLGEATTETCELTVANLAGIAQHPYAPRDLRHYKDTLTDIRPPNAKSYFVENQHFV